MLSRHRSGDLIEVNGARVRLRANPRARRVSLRIDQARGEVIATAPNERRLGEAVAFVHDRRAWIAQRLTERPPGLAFTPGAAIPFEGQLVTLEATGGAGAARIVRDPDGAPRIVSGGEGPAFARRIESLLRRQAREAVEARTAAHVETLSLKPPKVSVADPKSRWGSCSPHRNTIRYSWRLILASPEVLDYVCAHEVAHLVHADHSPAFWSVVRGLIGPEKPHRAWLRAHGAGLHAVGRV